MLETGEVLRTWELRQLPATWAEALGESSNQGSVVAVPLPDHRIDYLDYQGPLSDNRGSVSRCDAGSYETILQDVDQWELSLSGTSLSGSTQFTRVEGEWRLETRQ